MYTYKGLLSILICIAIHVAVSAKKTSLKVELERASIQCDNLNFRNCSSYVRKANRTASYTMNTAVNFTYDLDTNITIIFKSYEWMNNQYKESFIYFEKNLCNLVANDTWLFPTIRKYSDLPNKCPIKSGMFMIKDLATSGTEFGDHFPNGKWKFVINFVSEVNKSLIAHIDVEMTITDVILSN